MNFPVFRCQVHNGTDVVPPIHQKVYEILTAPKP
jgi:hypothetical protein